MYLSKRKYIYRIYSSDDKVIHCERHPVVYINSQVVYFKDGRKQEYLNYKRLNNVEEEFTGVKVSIYGYFEKFYWKVENFDSKRETEYAYSLRVKNDIENAKDAMDRVAKEYELKKQKYYELLKQ